MVPRADWRRPAGSSFSSCISRACCSCLLAAASRPPTTRTSLRLKAASQAVPEPAARSVGFLVERAPGGAAIEPACTATLGGTRTVVTSAQCVAGPDSSFTAVIDGNKRGVQAIHVRPSFDAEDLENGNDLAVLVLDSAIDGVTPAAIGETTDGASRIIGHGRTSTSGDGPHERRSLAAALVPAAHIGPSSSSDSAKEERHDLDAAVHVANYYLAHQADVAGLRAPHDARRLSATAPRNITYVRNRSGAEGAPALAAIGGYIASLPPP